MVTGTPIRIVFTPSRVEHVEPAGAVVAAMAPQERTNGSGEAAGDDGDIMDVDSDGCVQMPLFASAEAAQGWLAGHPGGRAFPVTQAWDLSPSRDWRDRMSAPAQPRPLSTGRRANHASPSPGQWAAELADAAMSHTPSIRNHPRGATR